MKHLYQRQEKAHKSNEIGLDMRNETQEVQNMMKQLMS